MTEPNRRRLFAFGFFFLVALVMFSGVLLSSGIPVEGEAGIPPFSSQVESLFWAHWFPWNPSSDTGVWNDSVVALYFYGFLYLLASVGLNGVWIWKILGLGAVTSAGFTMFLLCQKLKLSNFSAVVAGVFYMSSPIIFDRFLVGHIPIALDYSLAPLAVALFINAISRNYSLRGIATLTLVVLAASTNLTALFLLGFIFLLYSFFDGIRAWSLPKLRHNLILAFAPLLVVAVLEGLWLTITLQFEYNVIATRFAGFPVQILGDAGAPPLLTFRLLDFGVSFMILIAPLWSSWTILSFLLPSLAIGIALLSRPRDANVLFFGTLAGVGLTLAFATLGPLGGLYTESMKFFPPLAIFRDTSHWDSLTAIATAALLAFSFETISAKTGNALAWFSKNVAISPRTASPSVRLQGITSPNFTKPAARFPIVLRKSSAQGLILCLVLFGSFVAMDSWPSFTGNFGGLFSPYNFCTGANSAYQWLSSQPGDFRVLMLPAPTPTVFETHPEPYYQNNLMAQFPGKPFIFTGKAYSSPYVDFLIKTLYENRTNDLGTLLGLANVKYAILESDARTAATDTSWVTSVFPDAAFTNDKLLSVLGQQLAITQQKQDGCVSVYDNRAVLPHIFTVGSVGLVAGDLSSLVDLGHVPSFNLSSTGLIFLDQLGGYRLSQLQGMSQTFMLQDGYGPDFALSLLPPETTFNPISYVNEKTPDRGWAPLEWTWYDWYYQAQIENPAMTFVPSELTVPFDASQEGPYEIFAKSFFGPQSSKIAFFMDGTPIGTIQTQTAVDTGFRWALIGQDTISPGKHALQAQSSQGENALDSLVVVPKSQLDLANQTAQSLIGSMNVLAFSKLDSQTTGQSYELRGNALLDALGSSSKFRYPSSGQYAISGSNQNTSITLSLTQPANNTDELWCQIPLSLDISQFQQIDLTFKLSNPLQTFFEPILDLSLNGTETWLRFGDFSSLTSTLRSDGIYDIAVPVTPTNSLLYNPADQLLHLKLNLASVIRQVFHRLTQGTINQLRLGFGKNVNADFSNQGSVTLTLGQITFSGSKWFPMIVGSQASEGFAMSTIGRNVMNYSVYVPKTGPYSVFIRASSDAGGNITATLANLTNRVQLSTNRNYTIYSLGEFTLPTGYSNLQLTSPQDTTLYLDELFLKQEAGQSPNGSADLSYTRVDPAHFRLDVTAKTPASIFFSEAYNPSWVLKLNDGTTIPSVPGYGFGNLFIIDKPGTYSGTIEWSISGLYDFAKYLSLGVLATLVVLIALPNGAVGKRVRILRLHLNQRPKGKLESCLLRGLRMCYIK